MAGSCTCKLRGITHTVLQGSLVTQASEYPKRLCDDFCGHLIEDIRAVMAHGQVLQLSLLQLIRRPQLLVPNRTKKLVPRDPTRQTKTCRRALTDPKSLTCQGTAAHKHGGYRCPSTCASRFPRCLSCASGVPQVDLDNGALQAMDGALPAVDELGAVEGGDYVGAASVPVTRSTRSLVPNRYLWAAITMPSWLPGSLWWGAHT